MHRSGSRFTGFVVAVALVTVAVFAGGCSKKADVTPAPAGSSAIGSIEAARAALSTTAPDAKLLFVQTAQAATATGTPVWAYLFGSPKSGSMYVVYTLSGKVMGQQEYGASGLTDAEWAKVPGTDAWKIDSADAYKKALAKSGAKGDPNAYMMALMVYKPTTDTSTVEPFVWRVQFDPGKSGATTQTILVDAKTGAAQIAK